MANNLALFSKFLDKMQGNIEFKNLHLQDFQSVKILEDYISENIKPLYGNTAAGFLEKVKAGKDRTCEFLYYNDKPVGLIIYKYQLSDEFIEFGIKNGFELKSVFLIDKNRKTTGMFLYRLMCKAAQKAVEANATCIFGTVSAKKQDVLKLMIKLGFNVVQTFKGKYMDDVDEYLICHPNPHYLLIQADRVKGPTQGQERELMLC
jgi:hypothetical protein